MKKMDFFLLTLSTVLGTSLALATEPTNLVNCKAEVVRYYDSGEYNKDINQRIALATETLKKRLAAHKPKDKPLAIVLDIDETSLSNYADMKRRDFGGTLTEIQADEDKGQDSAILPTLTLFNFAKQNGVTVFFITGRQTAERQDTIRNLKNAGYDGWAALFMRQGQYQNGSAIDYKTAMRKIIEAKGYDIALNIGDQMSDLKGGHADQGIKLPNPYYFIA